MKIISILINFLIVLLSNTSVTFAGDFAKREILGFSTDGQLFAFEEFGVQDGSGFAYSNIFVINTNTDQWVENSPYRVRLDDETRSVSEAREEAKLLAGNVITNIVSRGNVVATNRATELGIDKKRMVANPRFVAPPIDDKIEIHLEEITFSASTLCEPFGPSKGFRLLMIGTTDGETTKKLHEDTSVPTSRNCPLQYELADLVTYYPEGENPVFAVLVRIRSVGFEGPDTRYLAVTGALE